MKTTIANALTLVVATAVTACVSSARPVVFDNRSDRSLDQSTALAVAATRAGGYAIAEEDDVRGAFVAVTADHKAGMLVEVSKPLPLPWGVKHCFNGCDTAFAVTPLVADNGRLVVDLAPSPGSYAAAWTLAHAIDRSSRSVR
jgi:hypothetical protein